MSESTKTDQRVTALEELVSHQQHLLEQLNEVVIQLRLDFDLQKEKHVRLQGQLNWILENHPAGEKVEEEKPPHY